MFIQTLLRSSSIVKSEKAFSSLKSLLPQASFFIDISQSYTITGYSYGDSVNYSNDCNKHCYYSSSTVGVLLACNLILSKCRNELYKICHSEIKNDDSKSSLLLIQWIVRTLPFYEDDISLLYALDVLTTASNTVLDYATLSVLSIQQREQLKYHQNAVIIALQTAVLNILQSIPVSNYK